MNTYEGKRSVIIPMDHSKIGESDPAAAIVMKFEDIDKDLRDRYTIVTDNDLTPNQKKVLANYEEMGVKVQIAKPKQERK